MAMSKDNNTYRTIHPSTKSPVTLNHLKSIKLQATLVKRAWLKLPVEDSRMNRI
jgi:hypothetical protein